MGRLGNEEHTYVSKVSDQCVSASVYKIIWRSGHLYTTGCSVISRYQSSLLYTQAAIQHATV